MNDDPELAERLRQFEVVCKISIQCAGAGATTGNRNRGESLTTLGAEQFDLTQAQVQYCLGRARNFLYDVRMAEHERNKYKLKLVA